VDQLYKQVRNYLLLLITAAILLCMGLYIVLIDVLGSEQFLLAAGTSFVVALLLSMVVAWFGANYALLPLRSLKQALAHTATPDNAPAPDTTQLNVGRQLVTELTNQIYQLASTTAASSDSLVEHRNAIIQASNVVTHMPLPLFVFNRDQLVTNASETGLEYCGLESSSLFGKKLFEVLNLEFPTEHTLEKWIEECQDNKVTDRFQWERVRIIMPGQNEASKQCDIAAYYNRDNPSGTEFIVTLFDRTKQYTNDEKDLSFVALAVHELRTPLSMLRGYVEVFQDELGPTLTPEMQDFMRKMEAAAKQLAGFVNNILNVARVEEDQLTLSLTEQNWEEVLRHAIDNISLRAQVHKKVIECTVEPGLPTVAVDRMSIQEVLNNLLDNAIKYSGEGEKQIIINARMNKDNMVETSVQDFGVGMPSSVVQNLFEKFYRNHRTKSQYGGSGLGLYLSKALITAHGGQIGVNSKEGEGTTFSFTLQPYSQLSEEHKDTKEITRSAHGWIKNHSLYRR
jgi:two-component system sensor histidine kinase VicK